MRNKRAIRENILGKSETELADSCRRYLQWLAVKNYSPHTITGHYYMLNFFVHWAVEQGVASNTQITCEVISRYDLELVEMTRRKDRPISEGYRYTCLHVVRAMFGYLVDNEMLAKNPAENLELPKFTRHRCDYVLGHKEIEEILRQPDVQSVVGLRDRAILEVIYSTGIRRREVIGLQVDDVDLHTGVLYVREGKGRKQRLIPIGERAIEWLSKYLFEARPLLLKTRQCDYLFLTYKGKGFTASGLANRVVPYVRDAGQKGCCHIFRHAMATGMLENGANVTAIQEILGHERLSSTQVYTHVSRGKLRQTYRKTHPENVPKPTKERQEIKKVSKPLYKWGGQPYTRKPFHKKPQTPLDSVLCQQVNAYLQAMTEKNFSPQTTAKRCQHLRRFLFWCDLRAIKEAQQVTHSLLERYHKDLYCKRHLERPLNPAYIARHLISVRCFFAWLTATGIICHNVAQKIKLPKRLKTIPYQILSQEEIAKIFAQVDTTDPLGVRDRAILALLCATGIRSRELCCLSVKNVDLRHKTLCISPPNGAQRIVPITNSAAHWLQVYLTEVRPNLVRPQSPKTLFLGRYGSHLRQLTLAEIIKRYFKKAAIQKPATCRIFRHTLATAMLQNGADIRHIQEILGHANLSSTQIYTKVSIHRLKEVHSQTHPASELKGKIDKPDRPTKPTDDNTPKPTSSS